MPSFNEHDPDLSDLSAMTDTDTPVGMIDSFAYMPPRRRFYRKKRFWLTLLLILAAGTAFYGHKQGWLFADAQNEASATHKPITVTRSNIEDNVTSQGKLEPKEYVDVGAQVSGQLKKIYVELGDTVKQGDLIAEIDPEILQTRVKGDEARLKTLQAQLAEQQAQITFAQQQYDRNARLIKQDAVSKEVLQNSEAELKSAQARAQSLRAQIEEANSTLHGDQVNLKFTKIYAPMSGTVVVQSAREGQTLNAVQSAPVIVQLAKLTTMTVRAQVAEADVTRIKPEMDVYFTILGDMERRWHGKVRQILPSPEVINEVVLYNVLVDVDNADGRLMTGMTTQMFFVLGEAKNVLTIPVTALGKPVPEQNTEAGDAYMVRVPNGKGSTDKVVHIGMMNRSIAEIRDGLSENDKILPAVDDSTEKSKTGGPRMGPRL